ncbi:MAG: hypothetical protein AB7E49_04230 [Campylobacterales bacterium]
MKTVTLKIADSVEEKFGWLLSHFSREEIEIVGGGFAADCAQLKAELDELDRGAPVVEEKEFWAHLDTVLGQKG